MRTTGFQLDAPNLADWLQGWGTIAGTLFAAIAAVSALALLRHERAARRADEREQAKRQARSVILAFDGLNDNDRDGKGALKGVTITLHNFSTEIISDITIAYRRADGASGAAVIGADYLAAGDKVVRRLKWSTPLREEGRQVWPPDLLRGRIAFTDAAGRRWTKADREQPRQLDADEAIDLESWAKAGD